MSDRPPMLPPRGMAPRVVDPPPARETCAPEELAIALMPRRQFRALQRSQRFAAEVTQRMQRVPPFEPDAHAFAPLSSGAPFWCPPTPSADSSSHTLPPTSEASAATDDAPGGDDPAGGDVHAFPGASGRSSPVSEDHRDVAPLYATPSGARGDVLRRDASRDDAGFDDHHDDGSSAAAMALLPDVRLQVRRWHDPYAWHAAHPLTPKRSSPGSPPAAATMLHVQRVAAAADPSVALWRVVYETNVVAVIDALQAPAQAAAVASALTRPPDLRLGGVCGDLPAVAIAIIVAALTGIVPARVRMLGGGAGVCAVWLVEHAPPPPPPPPPPARHAESATPAEVVTAALHDRVWCGPNYALAGRSAGGDAFLRTYLAAVRGAAGPRHAAFPRHLVTVRPWLDARAGDAAGNLGGGCAGAAAGS